jgi:WhiB family transcriptional regulator, redox-sensing transcriptional regulator
MAVHKLPDSRKVGAVKKDEGFTGQAAFELAWHDDAVCRTEGDPEWWFPSSGNSHAFTASAKALCARCPVRDECLKDGWNEQGTWGGMSREERLTAQELGFSAREVIKLRDDKEAHDAD